MSRWESQEYQDTHTSERKMRASSVQHVPKTALTKPALISLICVSSNKIFQCFKKWSATALTVLENALRSEGVSSEKVTCSSNFFFFFW